MQTSLLPGLRPGVKVSVKPGPAQFRVAPAAASGGFEDAFRSHYELGRPPRGPEGRAAVIHMALSMFDRFDVATDLASRVPKLGGHVATVDLLPGSGICIAKTAGPAHWSVWGRPLHLAGCAVEVVEVGS